MIKKNILSLFLFFLVINMAFGQVGVLTPINGTGSWAGKVIGYKLNTGKGVNTLGTDGLEAVITIYGNLQIRYKNKYQIYNGAVFNPTTPDKVPGTTHGIAFYVGDTNVNGSNVLYSNTRRGGTLVDHYQNDYNSYNDPSMTFSNTTVPPVVTAGTDAGTGEQYMSSTFTFNIDSKIYLYTIEYRYLYPEPKIKVKYSVNIPSGSKSVRVAHAFDTYLSGSDNGPGYYSSIAGVDAVMVRQNGFFEAFVYNSGTKWSGYHSANYNVMNDYLQGSTGTSSYMQFPNNIDSNVNTDNGIGISIDFGSTAGNYSSTNYIAFQCNAPTTAPVDTSFTPSLATTTYDTGCNPTVTFTYNPAIPAGMQLQFKEQSSGTVYVADASKKVYLPVGVYTYFFYDPVNSCVSPAGDNTVTITRSCTPCYKNPATLSGGLNPIAAVSTITNRNATANWQNSYKGADMVVESKAGGFVLNRLTQVQIAAIPAANLVEGMIVYNITTNKMNIYVVDGANTGWKTFEVQSCQ